jgi:YfiH family protein
MTIPLLEPRWSAPSAVRAAFSLRSGGISTAPWDTLNLGVHVGDEAAAVAENRRRLAHALALPAEPVWLEQVHGTTVLSLEPGSTPASGVRPRADAVVTRAAGVVLAIQVADCLPVLFASDDGRVLGAAHAGWRGLAAGVLEATLAAMAVPAGAVVAWLGPCIGPAHFEVGEEVRAAFMATTMPATAQQVSAAFTPNPRGRWQCDLVQLARQRLTALGVARVDGGEWCTAADPVRFFSHRRDRQSGRMAALLWC